MSAKPTTVGVLFATFTGVVWGGQFVVGKSALARVDSFWLTTMRYAGAAALLLALLAVAEGIGALSPRGRLRDLVFLGTLGFAGFNLLAYTGLEHARPENASLIVALAPLLTALVLWLRDGARPSRLTFVCLLVALVGVSLVISGGHPSTLWHGSLGIGDLLVLGGVLSFILYTIGAADHRDLSPLRYTALTATLGWPSIAAATVIGSAAGWLAVPSGDDWVAVTPELAYLALPGAVIAVLCWNAAVDRLGPQTTSLFGNLIPVSTFTIETIRGYRPSPLELVGAVITVGALVANNLLTRSQAAPEQLEAEPEEAEELLEAA
ncbi:MAG TPA: DMT family transporter [Gaiellaceae bacterium]|jgi:drug/metabolite transporter (DMT)-like permease